MCNTNDSWKSNLIAPLVVGIIVLLGQSLLQPYVAEKVQSKTQRWDAKREAFISALSVVDQQFAAHPFTLGPDIANEPALSGAEPSAEALNTAYRALVLYANDRRIIDAYIGCLGVRKGQDQVWHQERIQLVELMRKELGFDALNLKPDDVRFFVGKAE